MSKTPIERWVKDVVDGFDRLRAERNTGHRRGALDYRIDRLRAEREYASDDEARKANNVALGEIQFHGRPLPPSTPRRPVTPADLAAFPSPFAHDSAGAMSDYTPTTEEVRARYNADEFGNSAAVDDPCPEFDRWLEAHDREVAAKALREAATDMRSDKDPGHWNLRVNGDPEHSASPDAWLEYRADRIEREAER